MIFSRHHQRRGVAGRKWDIGRRVRRQHTHRAEERRECRIGLRTAQRWTIAIVCSMFCGVKRTGGFLLLHRAVDHPIVTTVFDRWS